MKTLGFQIHMLVNYIKHHKLLYFMMLLTLVVALLFPCMTVSDFVYANKKGESLPEIAPNIEIKFQGNTEDSYAVEEKLNELNLMPAKFGRSTFFPRNLIFYKDNYMLSHILGIDETVFNEFYTIQEGRGFTKEEQQRGEKVALVSYRAYMQNNMKLGDEVMVSGSVVKIIGVVFHEFNTMSLILPEKTMAEANLTKDYTVELYLWDEKGHTPEDYAKKLRPFFPDLRNFHISSGQSTIDMKKVHAREALYETILQGFLSLLFSSTCIWFMNRARLTQQMKIWGMKRTQGATVVQLIFDAIMDTLLISIPSLVISLCVLYIGRAFFSRMSTLLFIPSFFFYSFVMTVLLSVILGTLSGYVIARRQLLTMLEER